MRDISEAARDAWSVQSAQMLACHPGSDGAANRDEASWGREFWRERFTAARDPGGPSRTSARTCPIYGLSGTFPVACSGKARPEREKRPLPSLQKCRSRPALAFVT
jgi:hypothetical protein